VLERCFVTVLPSLLVSPGERLFSAPGLRIARRVESRLRLVIEVNADGEKFCAE